MGKLKSNSQAMLAKVVNIKCIDLSLETKKGVNIQNEPEIISREYYSPVNNTDKVLIENECLKSQITELQNVIISMCLKQKKLEGPIDIQSALPI